ncbi:hypothetical protein CYMTET_39521 [Cymbomonas tetramitiformis]|uniref:Uncharacterized protein n=1 Tax=Cymbomonas tetramitiformis TaxID=36881 RepID=A0AAE0CB41_9CHLO|nr:hypothetical protein CYMTET_39521 [Cymbomonas tetramitiformis]
MLFFFHIQASPVARRHVNSDGEAEWILLYPPELQTHVANTAHLLHAAVAAGMADARCCAPTASQMYPTRSSCPSFRLAPTASSTEHRHLCATPPPFALVLRSVFSVATSPCMFGEGTEGQIHAVDLPGNYHEVFHIDTKKVLSPPTPITYVRIHIASYFCNSIMTTFLPSSLSQKFVVAAAMAKSWMSYDAPTDIRCGNGPAFIGQLIEVRSPFSSLQARHTGFSYCLLWQASLENNVDMANTQSAPDVLHDALEELLQFFPL